MKKLWVIGFIFMVIGSKAHAECTVNIKAIDERYGHRYTISWDPVQGADTYVLDESFDNFRTVRQTVLVDAVPASLQRQFSHQTSVDVRVKYRVTASSSVGLITPCSATREVIYDGDAAFRRIVQKSAIPLVGSTAGLYGSLFKTSVRLRATADDQRGSLVLRRANVPGTDRDPQMTYALLKKGDVLFFDDIVAAFGESGLGSIDIIPDPSAGGKLTVPLAEVRLFNVSSTGTFGTIESQTQPYQWFEDSGYYHATSVVVPGPELRLNLGVRAFSASIVTLTVRRGSTSVASYVFSASGDTLLFGSAKDMLGGFEVLPGDVIRFGGQGSFVPMYTLTDNRTNDPALFIAPVKIDFDVETYIER